MVQIYWYHIWISWSSQHFSQEKGKHSRLHPKPTCLDKLAQCGSMTYMRRRNVFWLNQKISFDIVPHGPNKLWLLFDIFQIRQLAFEAPLLDTWENLHNTVLFNWFMTYWIFFDFSILVTFQMMHNVDYTCILLSFQLGPW